MIPASPARSSAPRTSTGSTPKVLRISACSRKSPCSARTPIFGFSPLPSTRREPLPFRQVTHLSTDHSLAKSLARLGHRLRVPEVGRGLHNCLRPARRVAALEDAAPDEHAVRPELHHQRRVRRGGDPTGGEEHHRQLPVLGYPSNLVVGCSEVLRLGHQLLGAECGKAPYAPHYGAHVTDGFDDVAGPGLALGPDHGRTLTDAPQ